MLSAAAYCQRLTHQSRRVSYIWGAFCTEDGRKRQGSVALWSGVEVSVCAPCTMGRLQPAQNPTERDLRGGKAWKGGREGGHEGKVVESAVGTGVGGGREMGGLTGGVHAVWIMAAFNLSGGVHRTVCIYYRVNKFTRG